MPDARRRVGIGINNAFVYKIQYIKHTPAELFLDLDIGVVGTGDFVDIKFLPDSAFIKQNFTSNQTSVDSISRIQLVNSDKYSNTLVLDGSSEWDEYDPLNLRTRALNKTILESTAAPGNELALGSFSRSLGHSLNYWQGSSGDAYNQSYEEYVKILMQYYFNKTSTSNLYDAIYAYLETVHNKAGSINKNLTVVVRENPDNQNTATVNQIITRAKAYGIKINMIILYGNYSQSMASIALRTKGFLNIISSTDQFTLTKGDVMDKGTPILGSIHRILSGNLHVYRLHLRLGRNSGTWYSGATVFDFFQTNIRYPDGTFRLNNYIPYYVQIP